MLVIFVIMYMVVLYAWWKSTKHLIREVRETYYTLDNEGPFLLGMITVILTVIVVIGGFLLYPLF